MFRNIVANVLPADPRPPDPGVGVKIPLFQNMVMFQNQLNGTTNATTL